MGPKIFYSWQSDRPNATNRGLILSALKSACSALGEDPTIDGRPEVDHDTQGVPGAPDIVETIFAKIDGADVFVGDISIITTDSGSRPCPNPNVLIELGYAIKTLGWSRIILVMNTAFGKPDLLPFDLKTKRATVYKMAIEDGERSPQRRNLERLLKTGLEVVLKSPPRQTPETEAERVAHVEQRARREGLAFIKAEAERMSQHATELNGNLGQDHLLGYLPLLFRPTRLATVRPQILPHIQHDRSLLRELDLLEGAAAAADGEAEKLLKGSSDVRLLGQLVRNVLSSSRAVSAAMEVMLGELVPK